MRIATPTMERLIAGTYICRVTHCGIDLFTDMIFVLFIASIVIICLSGVGPTHHEEPGDISIIQVAISECACS